MPTLLERLADRLCPPGGWALALLTLLALLCPVAALAEGNLDLNVTALIILTPLALLAGTRMALSRSTTVQASLIGAVLGILLVLILVGRLIPPLTLLWSDLAYAIEWLRAWIAGSPPWPWPFTATGQVLAQRFTELGTRIWWWSQGAAAGSSAQDTIVLALVTTSLAWASSFFATWQIYRHQAALIGLAPAGLAVTTAAFFGGSMSVFYMLVFVFCLLWLLAVCSLWRQQQHWDREGTDYPGSMGQELLITLLPWVILLLILAFAFPVIRPQQISDAFWRAAEGPWSQVEQVSEQLFGPMEGGFLRGTTAGSDGEGLPRSHLLGAGPDLTEKQVMFVKSSDPPPPPPPAEPEEVVTGGPVRYWRGATYDVYTGLGWENSPLERRSAAPGETLNPAGRPAAGPELIQSFELVEPGEPRVYAANEPLRVDREIETWWRAPGDLALMSGGDSRYTVISGPPEPTIAELRASSAVAPAEINERYLALPDEVPPRVLDLALQVTGGAETDYDRARAIESFLRTYTYTLDLPAPPDDGDLVDYFLFDVQEGYCDYYATSMVVMARAAGLPARLASGYAQGSYDYEEERWVVLEKDGHSWVEVYFDGFGWVEFEPTAGQASLVRPDGSELAVVTVPPLPPRAPRAPFPWLLLALGGLLLLLIGVIVAIWFRRPARDQLGSGGDLVRERQRRLLRWGARLGHPLRDGQTPREYGEELGDTLRDRGRASRWSRVQQARRKAPGEVEQISESYSRAQYGPEPISAQEGLRVRDLWVRLRRRLWWLWMSRR